MPGPGFVNLRTHSAYSLLEGALPLKKLIGLAVADDQPALGLADSANLFGALEFSVKAVEAGLQPIIACQVPIDFGNHDDRRGPVQTYPSVVLIARNEVGYANLVELVSRSYLETDGTVAAHLELPWFEGNVEGLTILSGGATGPADPLFLDGRDDEARVRLDRLHDLFGDELHIELQRYGDNSWKTTEQALLDYAYERGLPVVATNEAFFADAEDHDAHDALICLAEGRVLIEDDRRKLTPDHRFKTRSEMAKLFEDLPEALETSVDLARRCTYRPKTRPPILPSFTEQDGASSENGTSEAEELRRQAHDGLAARLAEGELAEGHSREDYFERLDFELSVIERMDYPGYFLIVADFIKWAKANGIPVGPGRGSGAASVVAWALTITNLDPLQFGLLFERFLNRNACRCRISTSISARIGEAR